MEVLTVIMGTLQKL